WPQETFRSAQDGRAAVRLHRGADHGRVWSSRVTVRIRLGAIAALAVGAMAGCSTNDPRQPEPQSTPSPYNNHASRPKDLKIANVDPCTLLTDAQMAQLNITRKAPSSGSTEGGSPSSCAYTVVKPTTYQLNVSLESKRGVDAWLDGTYAGQDVRQLQVQSYPAVQTLLA